MIAPTGFSNWKEYFSFVLAREYVSAETGEDFASKEGRLEKAGRSLAAIGTKPVDFFLREIRNPLVLLSTTAAALFLTSILFYPAQTWAITTAIFPFVERVKHHHIHALGYAISQSIILGLGARAYGRLGNRELMDAFRAKKIIPLSIGTQKVRVKI
jgi:hypothetical protein